MRHRTLITAAFTSLVLAACGRDAPPLVDDEAGLLLPEQVANLTLHHRFLLLDHDIDYRVVTRADGGDVDAAALELFESMSAGERSSRGRGLLLLLDSLGEAVRLEVGYSLEGVFPDAFVAYVENRQMVPFFAEQRVADGILASTELIIDRAQRASRNASWDDEIWMAGSGGAGATASTRAAPGFKTQPAAPQSVTGPGARTSPAGVVAAYLDAMRRRDNNPELEIYTPESRAMMRDWLVTPAQMDQVSRAYESCNAQPVIESADRDRAVIRYPIPERHCAPWFLVRGDGGWQLDLTMLQRAIRFGRSNAWHFDRSVRHPYEFAFEDWQLDANGFPIRPR
ncbi:MAG: TPM domain-containing protein [Xanthomonadales bacterium]|nr:TPM domain-containing protein [Xanthomonadales bacterium]